MRKTELEKRPDMIEAVEHLARTSMPQRMISARIGISVETFRNYLKRGRELMDEPPVDHNGNEEELTEQQQLYLQFFRAYEVSRSDFILDFHNRVWETAEPRTLLTIVERLFPKEFGPKTTWDEEQIDKWLSANFSEKGKNEILQAMENDLERRMYE